MRRGLDARRSSQNGSKSSESALDTAHIDHAAVALHSVDRLMSAVCDIANVSMHDLQASSSHAATQRANSRQHDPTEGALSSISAMAHAIAELGSM
jgi:hypothetical protein